MEFCKTWLADPKIYAVNRMAAHSSHSFYKTRKEAVLKRSSFVKQEGVFWTIYTTFMGEIFVHPATPTI